MRRCRWLTSWPTALAALMSLWLVDGRGRSQCGLGWRPFPMMLIWWRVMTRLGRGLRRGCSRA